MREIKIIQKEERKRLHVMDLRRNSEISRGGQLKEFANKFFYF